LLGGKKENLKVDSHYIVVAVYLFLCVCEPCVFVLKPQVQIK